jgi:hypothetical protein
MAFEVGQSSVIDNTRASSPSDSLNAEIWGGLVVIPASGSAIRKGETRQVTTQQVSALAS